MNLCRRIFSLLLLSTYVLLFLHDFIPHIHHDNQEDSAVSTLFHHNHDGHKHSHEHHEKKEKDDKDSDSSENSLFGDRLFDSHKHSENNGYHHDLAYRIVFKSEPVPLLLTFEYLVTGLLKLPDQLDYYNSNQFAFVDSFSNSHLSSGHGLRGPPALS